MGAIIAYLRNPSRCLRSQSSGLSPSPTEETAAHRTFDTTNGTQNESKLSVSATDESKPVEEPESNDTSYGVEATAVRTLAASTGTVAILGTTAKVLETTETNNLGDPSSIETKDNPSTLGSIAVPKVLDSEILSEETEANKEEINDKENKISEHAIVHESSDAENSVLQQKEIKQIENEAIQEKHTSELQGSLPPPTSSPEPSSPKEGDDKKNEEIKIETIPQDSPPSDQPESAVVTKDESQLPKIVDYQEKKAVVSPMEAEKPDVINKPINTETIEKAATPTSENSTEESKEPSIAATELPTPSEEERTKVPSDSSPDISKTEEDNEISSEQLKTNSLSDMSLSEAMNSEGEEAAREAAKALELQEMVASLSAAAKDTTLDYNIAIAEASASSESSVGTSARKSMELEPMSHETIIEEKYSPETNEEGNILSDSSNQIESSDFQTKESPSETSEPQSNESTASKNTEESKLSDKEDPNLELSKKEIINEADGDKKEDICAEPSVEATPAEEKAHEASILDEPVDDDKAIAAATAIQSTFRGYKTRKELKAQNGETQPSLSDSDIKIESNETISPDKEEVISPEVVPEKNVNENLEESHPEKKDEENNDIPDAESIQKRSENVESIIANAPASLVEIAQAEVDKICVEAEKATESLMTPPPTIDTDNIDGEYQDDNEEFPAPPDDLLDMTDKNDFTKEEQDSSGTEPTIPLGTNTEGDSSKTEDTTAPSFAESEVKSQDATPSQKVDDAKLESSITDNINTEVAINRDSTEGELTMEEDSKEEDIGSVLLTAKEQESDKTDSSDLQAGSDEEKAATVIQAGYRGFKTRQDLKKGTERTHTPEIGDETVKSDLKSPSKDELIPEQSIQKEISTTPKTKETSDNLPKTPEKIENISEPPNNELMSTDSNKKPKRPDQIDVVPRSEDISLIHGEDLSAAMDSDSKDDTSSTSLSEGELNEKASKIQAGIRGYLVRKDQKVKRDAAVKIQSTFRGFKTRQRLKQEEPVNVEVTKTS